MNITTKVWDNTESAWAGGGTGVTLEYLTKIVSEATSAPLLSSFQSAINESGVIFLYLIVRGTQTASSILGSYIWTKPYVDKFTTTNGQVILEYTRDSYANAAVSIINRSDIASGVRITCGGYEEIDVYKAKLG